MSCGPGKYLAAVKRPRIPSSLTTHHSIADPSQQVSCQTSLKAFGMRWFSLRGTQTHLKEMTPCVRVPLFVLVIFLRTPTCAWVQCATPSQGALSFSRKAPCRLSTCSSKIRTSTSLLTTKTLLTGRTSSSWVGNHEVSIPACLTGLISPCASYLLLVLSLRASYVLHLCLISVQRQRIHHMRMSVPVSSCAVRSVSHPCHVVVEAIFSCY
jgi:hypothetical protein